MTDGTADEESVVDILETLGELHDLGLALEDGRDVIGQRLQCRDQPRAVGNREIAQPAEMDGEQRQRHHGAGEGLGRDDGNFRPGMEVDAATAFAGDRAADRVDHAHDAATLALDLLHGGERVERFSRLTNCDVERVLLDHGIAIAKFGGGFCVCRNASELLDEMCAQRTCDEG